MIRFHRDPFKLATTEFSQRWPKRDDMSNNDRHSERNHVDDDRKSVGTRADRREPKDWPHRASARGDVENMEKGLHREVQDPDKQSSSRGGGGLPPSNAPVILLHRRGKANSSMLKDFDDEATARKYASSHKLMIVFSERKGDQLRLFYLPE